MAKKIDRLQLGKLNFIVLAIAVVLTIIGFIIMSFNEIVISTLILTLVYVVLVPFALIYKSKPKE